MVGIGYGTGVTIIFIMKMSLKARIGFAIALMLIMIWLIAMPKQQGIDYMELHLTLPFTVREQQETIEGTVYRNKKLNPNWHQDITEAVIGKAELTEEEWLKIKSDFSDSSSSPEMFEVIQAKNMKYELLYRYSDAGPVTYYIFIHVFSSDNYYRIVTRGIYEHQLIEFINSITAN